MKIFSHLITYFKCEIKSCEGFKNYAYCRKIQINENCYKLEKNGKKNV